MMQISAGIFKIDEVSSSMSNRDQGVAILKFFAQCNGNEICMSGLDIMTVSNDQIKEVWLYSGDQAAEVSFWAE